MSEKKYREYTDEFKQEALTLFKNSGKSAIVDPVGAGFTPAP
jgi:hypothetical protein